MVGGIIPAAGKGRRMNHFLPKQFLPLKEHPILYYALKVFEDCEEIEEIVLVVDKQYIDLTQKMIISPYSWKKIKDIVPGGETRQESVYKGLQCGKNWKWVVIHDAVRPFLSLSLLEKVIKEVKRRKAVTLGIPLEDTLKMTNGKGTIKKTVPREFLWRIQTPQAFYYPLILEAHEKAKKEKFFATDDAGLVEWLGEKVHIIMGSPLNIKITNPMDLLLAQSIIEMGKW